MAEKETIIYVTESILSSAIKDIISMGLLLGSLYINARYLGNSTLLVIFVITTFWLCLYK